jgi:hypothetical protein
MSLELIQTIALLCFSTTIENNSKALNKCQVYYINCIERNMSRPTKSNDLAISLIEAEIALKQCILNKSKAR